MEENGMRMAAINLMPFGGLAPRRGAARAASYALLLLGMVAGLAIMAAAAALDRHSVIDIRTNALVYIGGLVVCVCGCLLVVLTGNMAMDSSLPEQWFKAREEFWADYHSKLGLHGGSQQREANIKHVLVNRQCIVPMKGPSPCQNHCYQLRFTNGENHTQWKACAVEHLPLDRRYCDACVRKMLFVTRNGSCDANKCPLGNKCKCVSMATVNQPTDLCQSCNEKNRSSENIPKVHAVSQNLTHLQVGME